MPKNIAKAGKKWEHFLSASCGGLVRVKYAHRTPKIFRAPAKILRSKRFVGKGGAG